MQTAFSIVHCTSIAIATNYFHHFPKPINIRKYLNTIVSNLSTVVSPSLTSLLTQVQAVKFDHKKPIQLRVQNVFIFYMLQCKKLLPLCLPNKQAKGKCCNGKSTEVQILASPFHIFTALFSCLFCSLVALFSSFYWAM